MRKLTQSKINPFEVLIYEKQGLTYEENNPIPLSLTARILTHEKVEIGDVINMTSFPKVNYKIIKIISENPTKSKVESWMDGIVTEIEAKI